MSIESSVKIRDEYCSRCIICSSVCPFEAISRNKETGEVLLNLDKCQVCGICFSACPSSSIDIAYYKTVLLSEYVRRRMPKDNLILMCRGAIMRPELRENLKRYGVLDNSIQLYVPCIGRVSAEFLLKAMEVGVKRIVIVPCEDNKCRFKVGANVGISRLLLLQKLLSQFKLDQILFIAKGSIRAHINRNRCIGCGNCSYTCPSGAIRIVSPGVAHIDEAACSGCGACAAVCPSLAINLESFENYLIFENISKYRSLISEMKSKYQKPVIAVFYCQWANFPAPDDYRTHSEENTIFFEIPCSSMANPLYILRALYEGFDGVLVIACRKGECKFEKGNELAEKQISVLKSLLKQVGLENRLEICFTSPKYLGEINNQVKLFTNKIASTIEGSI